MADPDIYDPAFVADLFDRCSARYRWWSAISSFGFVTLWRSACVRLLHSEDPGPTAPKVMDLMAGTGEVWPHLLRLFPQAQITAIDISGAMHEAAVARLHQTRSEHITHLNADALTTPLPPGGADLVLCAFGLKTLTPDGQTRLARQIASVLRPGGRFALIEASDPKGSLLRPIYRFYLDGLLPLIERTVLRGAKDFSMIGTYTKNFGDCRHMAGALAEQGLTVRFKRHVFGCATSVSGEKPIAGTMANP